MVVCQLKGNMPYQVTSNLVFTVFFCLFVFGFKYNEHRSMEQTVQSQKEGTGGWVGRD